MAYHKIIRTVNIHDTNTSKIMIRVFPDFFFVITLSLISEQTDQALIYSREAENMVNNMRNPMLQGSVSQMLGRIYLFQCKKYHELGKLNQSRMALIKVCKYLEHANKILKGSTNPRIRWQFITLLSDLSEMHVLQASIQLPFQTNVTELSEEAK